MLAIHMAAAVTVHANPPAPSLSTAEGRLFVGAPPLPAQANARDSTRGPSLDAAAVPPRKDPAHDAVSWGRQSLEVTSVLGKNGRAIPLPGRGNRRRSRRQRPVLLIRHRPRGHPEIRSRQRALSHRDFSSLRQLGQVRSATFIVRGAPSSSFAYAIGAAQSKEVGKGFEQASHSNSARRTRIAWMSPCSARKRASSAALNGCPFSPDVVVVSATRRRNITDASRTADRSA